MHTVSGSISLPSQGFFSPFPHGTGSLSVSQEYLALEDGPPIFKQDFSCPALLNMLLKMFRIRDYHPLRSSFPACSSTLKKVGYSPFARRYLGNLIWCLFLGVLRCFTSPGLPPNKLGYLSYDRWVSPFRYRRITGYCRLPDAFRRLSRLSSPLTAKASTMCTSLLDYTTLCRLLGLMF